MAVSRFSVVDALKVAASLIIVFHHLTSYGPVAEALQRVLPTVSAWSFDYGRMVVQVFLVAGGFLGARSLAPEGYFVRDGLSRLIAQRYWRLVLPLMAAVLCCVATAAVARQWSLDDTIPSMPRVGQMIAHMLLLQDVLGVPALSAGVWYVAIDFQLYALLAVLLWGAKRLTAHEAWNRFLSIVLVAVVALCSLVAFNRDPDWDVWALYHFAAYGLGALTYWWSRHERLSVFWMSIAILVVGAAVFIEFRHRLVLAAVAALLIGVTMHASAVLAWCDRSWVQRWAKRSYSLFLIHYPLLVLANALLEDWLPSVSVFGVIGAVLVLVWVCFCAADVFYRYVECKTGVLVEWVSRGAGAVVLTLRGRASDKR